MRNVVTRALIVSLTAGWIGSLSAEEASKTPPLPDRKAGSLVAVKGEKAPVGKKNPCFVGKVVTVDSSGKRIVVKFGNNEMAFDVADNAKIRKMGKDSLLSSLAAGDQVMVRYEVRGNGNRVVSIDQSKMEERKLAGDNSPKRRTVKKVEPTRPKKPVPGIPKKR